MHFLSFESLIFLSQNLFINQDKMLWVGVSIDMNKRRKKDKWCVWIESKWLHFSSRVAHVSVSPALRGWPGSEGTSEGSRLFGRTQPEAAEPRWRGWAGPEAEEASGCWLVWADQEVNKERYKNKPSRICLVPNSAAILTCVLNLGLNSLAFGFRVDFLTWLKKVNKIKKLTF